MNKEALQELRNADQKVGYSYIHSREFARDTYSVPKLERTTIYTPRNHEGHIPAGSLVIVGEIDEETTRGIFYELDKLANDEQVTEISIYIHSPGGNIVDVLPIANKIMEIDKPIRTVGIGYCYSGAAFILAAGTPGRRLAYPDAEIMLHSPMGGIKGSYEDIRQYWCRIAKMNNRYLELLSEFTGQPKNKLRKDLKIDKFFTAKEAKDYGIIDQIIRRSKKYVQIREENGFPEEE